MKTFPLFAAATSCLVALPGIAFAQSAVTWLGDVSTSDRPMVLAANGGGIVFIGPDGNVFRGYHHEQTSRDGYDQPFLWVEDIDDDGNDEFVGAGTPAFVVDDNADPVWGIADGCDQLFIGDFADDDTFEVFCRGERSVQVYSWDGQEYLTWEGRGWNVGTCYADDYDGDRELEVACALNEDEQLFFDLEYLEPEEKPDPVEPVDQQGVDTSRVAAAAAGSSTVDLGGDTTIGFSGSAIVLSRDGAQFASIPVGSSAIHSAIVADLDGNGANELYVGGDGEVYVIDQAGTLVSTVPVRPSALSRDARVTIRSATAAGLTDGERETTMAAVEAGLGDIRGCYANRMGQDQFTRVGVMIWELTVDDGGDVDDMTRRHSSLQNRSLEDCIGDALEDLSFSPAADGSGVVSVTLDFDFVDTP